MMARSLPILFLGALAGCASTVTTLDGRHLRLSSLEFGLYFERVFRDQNEVATVLAFAQSDVADGSEFVALEDDLLAACAGLNELALASRDGRSLSRRRQAGLAATAPACEEAVANVRRSLAER
ncbi:MAG: hypothetical protein ACR2QQ_07530 [Gammaproteobacteria bacterium]